MVRSGGVRLLEKWAGLGFAVPGVVLRKTAAMGSWEFGRRFGPRNAVICSIDSGVASFSLKIAKWHTKLSRGEPGLESPLRHHLPRWTGSGGNPAYPARRPAMALVDQAGAGYSLRSTTGQATMGESGVGGRFQVVLFRNLRPSRKDLNDEGSLCKEVAEGNRYAV